MNLRRQKMIEETISALFWWWKAGVIMGGSLSVAGTVGVCCVWLIGGYGSLPDLWEKVKQLAVRIWISLLSIKLPSWIVPDRPRSLWKTIVICSLVSAVFSTPFFILCSWKLLDLFMKLTNETDPEEHEEAAQAAPFSSQLPASLSPVVPHKSKAFSSTPPASPRLKAVAPAPPPTAIIPQAPDGEEAQQEHCEKFPAEELMQNEIGRAHV